MHRTTGIIERIDSDGGPDWSAVYDIMVEKYAYEGSYRDFLEQHEHMEYRVTFDEPFVFANGVKLLSAFITSSTTAGSDFQVGDPVAVSFILRDDMGVALSLERPAGIVRSQLHEISPTGP